MPPIDPRLTKPELSPQAPLEPKQVPQTPGLPPTVPVAPAAPTLDPRLKQIRTYQGDVEEALRSQHESVFSIREQELARQKLLEHADQAVTTNTKPDAAQPIQPEAGPTIGPKVIPEFTSNILPNVPHIQVPLSPIIAPRAAQPVYIPPRPQVIPQTLPPYPLPRKTEVVKGPNDWKTAGLFILSLALLAGAGTAGYFAYMKYETKVAVPAATTPGNQLIPSDSSTIVNTSSGLRINLISALRTNRTQTLAAGTIKQIDLRKGATAAASTTSTSDFFNLIASHAPSALVRAFNPVFMMGLVGEGKDTPPSTFMIIKIDSFDNVFAGMLDWEQDIPRDLIPLFYDASTSDSLLSASTTLAFQDLIVKNKDTRALRDQNQNTVLIYSFYDQQTLIVTDSEDNLRSIISLLTSQKLTQ